MKLVPILLLAMATGACTYVPTQDSRGHAAQDQDKVLVCHKGKNTLELPREAVSAHIDHGDSHGPCR